MDKMKYASIVIPIYNQWLSLKKVLLGFKNQTVEKNSFEIIIIDDGSDDETSIQNSISISNEFNINVNLYHQENRGRATARNKGVLLSQYEIIVFCDADRVPCPKFLENHIKYHELKNHVVIGEQYDIFSNQINRFFNDSIDWEQINRFSRLPNYYKRIKQIYNNNQTSSNLAWMSFLVGNLSIDKESLSNVNYFDEDFKEWGFEHFELGLRLQKNICKFINSQDAVNYHIPHSRGERFYFDMIEKSAKIILQKHPEINIEIMKKIILNNVQVKDFEDIIFKIN